MNTHLRWEGFVPPKGCVLTGCNCAHRHEEHGKETGAHGRRDSCDDVADDRNDHEADDMQRAVTRLGRRPSHRNRD